MRHGTRIFRDSAGTDPVDIRYREEPVSNIQKRLKGRIALVPEIDLDCYRTHAEIDWVSFTIETKKSTQHQHVNDILRQRTGKTAYVETLNPGVGNAATKFNIRFQEPDMFTVALALNDIETSKGFASPAKFEGLEVSLDFYPRIPSDAARGLLYGVLVRHMLPPLPALEDRDRWPRQPDLRGNRGAIFSIGRTRGSRPNDLRLQYSGEKDVSADYGNTFYIGRKDDEYAMWRLMLKDIDTQNPITGNRILPLEEQRVRMEVSLGPEALIELELRTMKDFRSLSFGGLQRKFFQVRLPTFQEHSSLPPSPMKAARLFRENQRRKKFLQSGVMGLQIMERAGKILGKDGRPDFRRALQSLGRKLPAERGTDKHLTGSLVNYEGLSRQIEQALRHLGERELRFF